MTLNKGELVIKDLIPHSGRMIFLDEVERWDDNSVVCRTVIDGRMNIPGADFSESVPTTFGLEIMAQAIAVHGGLLARRHRNAKKPGLFVAARSIEILAKEFTPGQQLRVIANRFHADNASSMYDCRLESIVPAVLCMSGRINIFHPQETTETGMRL